MHGNDAGKIWHVRLNVYRQFEAAKGRKGKELKGAAPRAVKGSALPVARGVPER